MLRRAKCPFCNHVWVLRTLNPKECPKCKNYFKKKKVILEKMKDDE